MPRLPIARTGSKLAILQAPVEFSYFPTYQGVHRVGMHTKVYASDAWVLIKAAIRQDAANPHRDDATAFADQAEKFYRAAANAKTPHGRPLLLYYCFMNLVKALCLHRGNARVLGKAMHGVADTRNQFVDLDHAIIEASPSTPLPPPAPPAVPAAPAAPPTVGAPAAPAPPPSPPPANVFHEFLVSALSAGLTGRQAYQIRDVLACSLVGHRLWTEAAQSVERFLKLTAIEIIHDSASRALWLRARIAQSSLSRHGFTQAQVTAGGFGAGWQAVRLRTARPSSTILWEQTNAVTYTHRPSDSLEALAASARRVFYRSLTTSEPFRNYYVYVPPTGYAKHDQLAARYILLFFLGSVTRYHPHNFESYLNGPYGPFLAEFLASEPSQMLFELACLFLKREIVTVGLT